MVSIVVLTRPGIAMYLLSGFADGIAPKRGLKEPIEEMFGEEIRNYEVA